MRASFFGRVGITTRLKSICWWLFALTIGPMPAPSQSHPAPKITDHLNILGFTLGSTTLNDVQTRLGPTMARKCSQEEEAPTELCYTSGESSQTTVVLEAGFSGGWKELDGYPVIAAGFNPTCYRKCVRSSKEFGAPQSSGGLKLGMTRKQVIDLLGRPTRTRGNELKFEWQTRQAMTREQQEAESRSLNVPVTDPYFDVIDNIDVTLADLKVVMFAVHHMVSR